MLHSLFGDRKRNFVFPLVQPRTNSLYLLRTPLQDVLPAAKVSHTVTKMGFVGYDESTGLKAPGS